MEVLEEMIDYQKLHDRYLGWTCSPFNPNWKRKIERFSSSTDFENKIKEELENNYYKGQIDVLYNGFDEPFISPIVSQMIQSGFKIETSYVSDKSKRDRSVMICRLTISWK